jgi:hypothetical protein
MEVSKRKINELDTDIKNKNIRDLHKGINTFKGDNQEQRLRVFEDRVVRRIFRLKEGGSGGRLEKTA